VLNGKNRAPIYNKLKNFSFLIRKNGRVVVKIKLTRICIIVHKNYFFDSRVRRYAESLLKCGTQVDIICPPQKYITNVEAEKGLTIYTIPIQHHQRGRFGYVLEYGLSFVLYSIYLLFLHIKKPYQVIHVHNLPDLLAFSALIPRILGIPLILDIHDPMPELFISKYGEEAHKFTYRLIVLQEKLSCMLANAVITANSLFKQNLVLRGTPAEKITVINNYPDLKIFNRSSYIHVRKERKETFTLIYPGTIAPRYGLQTAISALPLLITRIPNISLVIIGPEAQHKDHLKQIVEKLGLSAHTVFLPLAKNDEIPRRIAQADIGIYPALCDAHMNIATPTKVLEYAAMGIPIVSSRLRIIEELFGNSSVMLFEPGDVNQFAQCVIKLFENPSLREELVFKVDQEFVQKHFWENEFRDYLELLNQLLHSKF
jgi:glycosyltransferase involved in cell wall biosynthesis